MKAIPMLSDEKHQVRIKRYVSNGVGYIPTEIFNQKVWSTLTAANCKLTEQIDKYLVENNLQL